MKKTKKPLTESEDQRPNVQIYYKYQIQLLSPMIPDERLVTAGSLKLGKRVKHHLTSFKDQLDLSS